MGTNLKKTEGLFFQCIIFEKLTKHSDGDAKQLVGYISLECRSDGWAKVINTINKLNKIVP